MKLQQITDQTMANWINLNWNMQSQTKAHTAKSFEI
jgi:hypothetical protein